MNVRGKRPAAPGAAIVLLALAACSSKALAPPGGTGAAPGSGGTPRVTPSETCPPPPSYAPFGCAPTYGQQAGNVCMVLGVATFEGNPVCGGWSWTCSTTQTCLYDAQQRLIYAKWCDDIVPGYVCVHSGCSCDRSAECLESANLDPTVGICASTDGAIDASRDAGIDRAGDANVDGTGTAGSD